MLNISENSISAFVDTKDFKTFNILSKRKLRYLAVYLMLLFIVGVIAAMFLPWTQNIQSKGYLTTLTPDQKPQAIQSVIAGRLEKWFVQEGNLVEAGDTIVYISEVKSEYFDPQLIDRVNEQVAAKSQSVNSYDSKVKSLEKQYQALTQAQNLKIQQLKNKIQQSRLKIASDSLEIIAIQTNFDIAQKQQKRTQELFDKGLKSLTDLEAKNLKLQETQAKLNIQQNKLLTQRNELLNLQIEISSTESEYQDKLAKSQSDKFSALSNKLDAQATTSKLENQLSNYSQRQKFYYITAPQAGYVTKAIKKGLGEIIKEGTDIVTIMPAQYDLAVESYIKPRDLPLIEIGTQVQLQFDGWPSIAFSGWPNAALGTFDGTVFAIDQFISDNGSYRILVLPDEIEKTWPDLLRVGTGTKTFMLLKDVPIWYEIWRQLNGFPPDFYKKEKEKQQEIKRKAPIKSVK